MMAAKVCEGYDKHFCREVYVDNFTSKPEAWSEAAGLSFENVPQHLRGLKDFEIELLLSQKQRRRSKNHRC